MIISYWPKVFVFLGGVDWKVGWYIQRQRYRLLLNAPRLGRDTWSFQEFAQFFKIVSSYTHRVILMLVYSPGTKSTNIWVIPLGRLSGKLRSSKEGADTIIWLALQPKEKLVSGSFYFDRSEALKHLPFVATDGSHNAINSIVTTLRTFCSL